MKVKECREAITDNLKKVRCSGDLELIKKVTDLIIAVDREVDLDRNCIKLLLLVGIMDDAKSDKDLRLLHFFLNGMENADRRKRA